MRPGASDILEAVDPRLRDAVRSELETLLRSDSVPALREDARWVLAGHRAAGKSTLLRKLAPLCARPAVDLDAALEARAGRTIRDWFRDDAAGFRAAEREALTALPSRAIVAVGGGFLSLHGDLLADAEVILVPVTFETFRERLLKDATRPRLRPELDVEEELRIIFDERERAHASVRTRSLAQVLAALLRGGS